MRVVKCENGHYYDSSRFEKCPHCGNKIMTEATVAEEMTTVAEEITTVALEFPSVDSNEHDEEDVTIGIDNYLTENKLLSGWLVCTKGIVKGKDFRLYNGWNRIGRSMDMFIYIPEDMKVSNKEHAAVVYDNKSNKFFLVNQFATLTYLNEELVKDAIELNNGDRITVGDTELVFVAFCTEERKWQED